MSRGAQWFPLYVGDYLADTMHLSTQEHGAYLLLLMHSWRNGPLPSEDRQIARIARLAVRDWARVRDAVMAFFTLTEDGFVQLRLERVRGEQQAKSEKARAAAHVLVRNKKIRRLQAGDASGRSIPADVLLPVRSPSADTVVEFPLAKRSTEPEPEIESEKEESPPTPRKRVGVTSEKNSIPERGLFERFWCMYPKRVGKGQAERAWASALRQGALPDDLLEALRMQVPEMDLRDGMRFLANPATWLNGRRWLDGIDPADMEPLPVPPPAPQPASQAARA